MEDPEGSGHLDLRAMLILIILTLFWGFNHTAIKYSNEGIAPLFASALRSVVASFCGIVYCLKKREPLFHTDLRLFHGVVLGLLFGLQFACIYLGLFYTDAVRSVVFIHLTPFVVAVGAHFFLKDDRLTFLKVLGLLLAFSGILFVFHGRPTTASEKMLIGDLLEIIGGLLWGIQTLYVKRFMAGKVSPINTFLYLFFFSIPVLFILSFIIEPKWIDKSDFYIIASLFYQSVIVAFISYFLWFKMIHKYSASRVTAFTFLTPVFGVLFGVLLLKEEFTLSLMAGLPLVSMGIFFVNWRKRAVK